jgi:gentisate 1,2-dioxygenase
MPQSHDEKSSEDVEFFEYTKAANPLAKGSITPVSFGELSHTLHEGGPTRVIPFDLSDKLNVEGPATSPNLSANFLRIQAGESLSTRTNSTSELYYVLRGAGSTERKGESLNWATGDFFVLPGGADCKHTSSSDYLWVYISEEKFSPTIYKADDCRRELKKVAEDPSAKDRNRVSVLLANKKFSQTMTVTHTLWAMFGILPEGAIQLPHRHNSVALDLILDCKPGCYTMVAKEIDQDGYLIQPVRQDWKPYSAFVTPPYYWHAHYNESGSPAHLIPIQDAGLQTYMRTLDIEFAHAPKAQSEARAKSGGRQTVVSGVG